MRTTAEISARRERPLVLLVEDQADLRQLYAQQLICHGFDVIEAENGDAAIVRTSEHAPDVVLMDLSLPVVDGWEATRRLKGDTRTAHIPIVALTAHALATDRARAMEAGCDAYLAKPVEPRRVLEEVRRLLDQGPPADPGSGAGG